MTALPSQNLQEEEASGKNPFTLGITGHRKLVAAELPMLRQRVAEVLAWVRGNGSAATAGLGEPLGLRTAPINLLSSLAPGADILVAQVAKENRCQIIAPLSFFADASQQHQRSTAFNGFESDRPLVAALADRAFVVRLVEDEGKSDDELKSILETLLQSGESAAKSQRYRRYRAAGEYIAASSHLLIAITDTSPAALLARDAEAGGPPVENLQMPDAGSNAIIRVRLRGLSPSLLLRDSAMPLHIPGPVLHLAASKDGIVCPSAGELSLRFPEESQTQVWEGLHELARKWEPNDE